MLLILATLWDKFRLYIIAVGAALGVVAGVYAKGRLDQKENTDLAVQKQKAKDLETARSVSNEVNSMPDADLDAGLSKFMRDKR